MVDLQKAMAENARAVGELLDRLLKVGDGREARALELRQRARHVPGVRDDVAALEARAADHLVRCWHAEAIAARLARTGVQVIDPVTEVATPRIDLVRAVNEVGIDRFIGKPWNDYDLMSAIGQALDLARKFAALNQHYYDSQIALIHMLAIFRPLIDAFAASATVLPEACQRPAACPAIVAITIT